MKRFFLTHLAKTSRFLKFSGQTYRPGLFLLYFFLFPLTTILAQPAVEWDKRIVGSEPELFAMVKQTADGGYILGGTSISPAEYDKTENPVGGTRNPDYWIVKLNAAGEKQWDNTLGGNDWETLTSIDPTADGGYIVAGRSDSKASGDKSDNIVGTWIVKLDAAGNKQWDKTLEKGGEIIEQTPDGGYVLSGGGSVLKLNSSGSILWERADGTVQQTADNGFLVFRPWLAVKLNAVGVTEWEQPLSVNMVTQQTADGGYLAGNVGSSDDYQIIKLNAAGVKEWEKTFGGTGRDELRALRQTADGGYILGGESYSDAGGDKTEGNLGDCNVDFCYNSDFWVIKLDAAGNRVWDKTIGLPYDNDQLRYLEQTADGGFILGGLTGAGWDYYAVKLAGETTSPPKDLCQLALTSKVVQAEPWYGMYPGGEGSIDITVTGGTPPYTYRWNTWSPGPYEDYPFANPTVHTVVVTDAQGCMLRTTIEVGKKNDPMRLQTTHTNVITTGDPTGSIDLTVVGGTGPYKYLWSNGATSEDLTGLAVGTYAVTVTDAFGRKLSTSVTIVNPRNPTPVVCNLVATSKTTPAEPWYGMWGPTSGAGAIDVTPSGGTAPYTYRWNTGATTEDLAVAPPGVYTVTITDAQACTTRTTVTIARKNAALTLAKSHSNVTTGGTNNGSIDVSVVGGTGPFKYRWNNGATTEDLTNLAAGTYSVTVTDAFGRTATLSVQVQGAGGTAAARKPNEKEVFIDKETGFTVYPNPAKEQTKINLNLAATGNYTLDLFDIRGAKVKTLATGQAQANKVQTLELNLNSLAEGVYLLKLQSDKGVSTKRLSVAR